MITLLLSIAFSGSFGVAQPVRLVSSFATTPPEVRPGVAYDPVLTSLVASLKSREPARDLARWETVQLPARPDSLCPGTMTAYLKRASHAGAETFVILPGSYSTWTRGSFVSQTAAALGDANVLAFPGYLTIEFLSGVCTRIPWDSLGLAEDMYARLRACLPEGRAGVVGFSGGGYLAIAMLAADARAVSRGERRVFELGGRAFSPLLHGRTAFANLDRHYRESPISRSHTLVSLDLGNLAFLARNLGPPDWRQIIDLFQANRDEIVARTFNQFTSDLIDTVRAVGAADPRPRSHHQAYVKDGFWREAGGSLDDLDRRFDAATDLGPRFAEIDRPLLIYVSQDDPILPGSPEVELLLRQAARNPSILVMNPRYGGHAGALLDPLFENLLFPEAK